MFIHKYGIMFFKKVQNNFSIPHILDVFRKRVKSVKNFECHFPKVQNPVMVLYAENYSVMFFQIL